MKRHKVKHNIVQKRHKAGEDSDIDEELNAENKANHHVEGIEANQNEAAMEIETSPTLAEYLESDGVADIHGNTATGSRSQTLTNTTKKKLPAGFGFSKETRQYRHATERSHNASMHTLTPVYEIGQNSSDVTDKVDESPSNKVDVSPSNKVDVSPSTKVDASPSNINNQVSNGAKYSTAKTYADVVGGASKQQSINNDNDTGLVSTNQACMGQHITTEQMPKPDIEMDVIYTRKLREKILEEAPDSVPSDYVDMNPKNQPTEHKMTFICMIPIGRKEPDQTSIILIPHKYADNPEGDEFGARLCTFKEKQSNGHVYYRHFLVAVEPGGPADCMRIEKNDEIVLLNDTFTAALTHTETLNLFHKVKVDGHTRFTLVIRRVKAVQNKAKWQWIKTSAVLAPDKEKDERPIVEDLEYKPLRGNMIEVAKSSHLYKVPGTDRYLEISTSSARIDVHTGNDMEKIVWKRLVYRQNDSGYIADMRAALCDHTMTSYITFDQQDNIILQPKPEWYKIITIGDIVRFKLVNKDLYMGYDLDTGQMKAQISRCVFHELPAPKDGEIRHPFTSGSSDSASEDAGQSSSCRSSRSSISSQISIDSSGCNVSFQHSSSTDSAESALLPLSQSSSRDGNTSVYISTSPPNRQPDEMDTGQQHDMSLNLSECENSSLTTPKTPTTPMLSLAIHDDNVIEDSKGY